MQELPNGSWLEVLDSLCSNTTYDDKNIQYASLLSLGYICEELRTDELKKEQADFVISAFLDSLEKNGADPDLTIQTIMGIYHSMKFAVSHFHQGQGDVIMDNVIKATKYPNVEVREIAMQCIVEIVRL